MNVNDFHFIRPMWLIALMALPLIIWLIKRIQLSNSGWISILPPHLSQKMIEHGAAAKSLSLFPAAMAFIITIVALAGPTWQKLPQPVYQVERGSVIIMDMSYSMYATDITPNRLTRARYKAVDLLDQLNEGDIGLIAYAGDAFTISPLTQDINNIKLLLPSLSPDLMPVLGSNPLAALTLAQQMLTNAGHIEGDIYWFTDGIDSEDVQDLNAWTSKYPHKLHILGIGSYEGAPIKLTNGELLKDDNGAIVIPKLSAGLLEGVATNSGGNYQTIAIDSRDIKALASNLPAKAQDKATDNTNTGDQWQEAGPYLLLMLLPLLLPYFRRGVLFTLLPAMLLMMPSQDAMAIDWQDLWKTKDQQAQQAFNQEQYQQAATTFEDPMWKGSAHFKAGDYQAAADEFSALNSAQGFYNQGNALAKLNQLDQAIAAYDKALALNPNMEDAKANKALLEQLKQQQDQQNNQQQGQNQEQNQDSQNDQQQNDQQGQQQGDDQNQQNQSSDQQQSQSDQQSGQENSQQQQDSQQQSQQSQSDPSEQNADQNKQQNKIQQDGDADKQAEQQAREAQAKEQEQSTEQQADSEQAVSAQQQQIDQEKALKHQQLLKKVTDDPYLLLRNKMQLEYQKRRQEGSNSGDKKKW
ncbi:VWA domain-containing protein [Colwellia sp. MEBiC06753]